jgi:hypothetical protein
MKIKIYRTAILPVVLYRCEAWCLTSGEECGLRVFENRVLWNVFGPKGDKVTGEWRRLRTVKSVISGTSGTKNVCQISQFSGCQNIILKMYVSVHINLMDRPYHVTCHFISCPVFHAALPSPLHHCLRNKVYTYVKKQDSNI